MKPWSWNPWADVEGLRTVYDMDRHACVLLCGDEVVYEDQGVDTVDTYGVQEQNNLIHNAVQEDIRSKRWDI